MKDIANKISNGADAFLFQEYIIILIFVIIFGAIIFIIVDLFG